MFTFMRFCASTPVVRGMVTFAASCILRGRQRLVTSLMNCGTSAISQNYTFIPVGVSVMSDPQTGVALLRVRGSP